MSSESDHAGAVRGGGAGRAHQRHRPLRSGPCGCCRRGCQGRDPASLPCHRARRTNVPMGYLRSREPTVEMSNVAVGSRVPDIKGRRRCSGRHGYWFGVWAIAWTMREGGLTCSLPLLWPRSSFGTRSSRRTVKHQVEVDSLEAEDGAGSPPLRPPSQPSRGMKRM